MPVKQFTAYAIIKISMKNTSTLPDAKVPKEEVIEMIRKRDLKNQLSNELSLHDDSIKNKWII